MFFPEVIEGEYELALPELRFELVYGEAGRGMFFPEIVEGESALPRLKLELVLGELGRGIFFLDSIEIGDEVM
jgi:hypothetical protein